MKRITLLLSWRYLLGATYEKNISTMTLICFLGIIIGSFSLALVVSIMNGFEQVTHEKMQGIHAQIIIKAYGDDIDFEKIKPVLQNEFPAIAAVSPNSTKQGIIQKMGSDDITNVVMIKGINPEQEAQVSILEEKISKPKLATLQSLLHDNHVLIGKSLAETLECTIDDHVNILFTKEEQLRSKRVTFDHKEAIIGGIFNTGIDEFDQSLIFCSLPFFNKLFPDNGITQINVKLQPNTNEEKIIKQLQKRLNLEIFSWKDLYPALVSALKLEKYAMFFILALIVLVASMNIISLLFMQIIQKRGDIAILKAMGLANSEVSSIFLIIGMSISLIGSLIGLVSAFFAGLFLQHYPFIELPDAYYVSHLPVSMSWHIFITIFFVIMILSFIATWIPARETRSINIAHVLRFEA